MQEVCINIRGQVPILHWEENPKRNLVFLPEEGMMTINVDEDFLVFDISLGDLLTEDLRLPGRYPQMDYNWAMVDAFMMSQRSIFSIPQAYGYQGIELQSYENGISRIIGPHLPFGYKGEFIGKENGYFQIEFIPEIEYHFQCYGFSLQRLMFYLYSKADNLIEPEIAHIGNYLFYDHKLLVPDGESESGLIND